MGFWEKFKRLFKKEKKINLVILGLDNAGKTTIIYKLNNKNNDIYPTIGVNKETYNPLGFNIKIFDLSGNQENRDDWENYYQDIQGIIYVLDSSDKERQNLASYEFLNILNHKAILWKKIPILIYLNKMDVKDSLNYEQGAKLLKWENIKNKSWHLQRSNAINGNGIIDGIDWILSQLDNE